MGEGNVVALQNQQNGELMNMDTGTADEMSVRLAEMKSKLSLVKNFFQDVMDKDVDFGIIPGTDKPTLYKPGAEKLCELYGFSPVLKEKKETRDFKTGYYLAEVVMQIIHRKTGLIVAEGVGEACSYESKYRYRWLYGSKIPKEVDKESLVKQTFTNKRTGEEYVKYRMENPDLIDQWNTVLKMAKKRALVDAVLSATRSSGIFSQSEDEMELWINGESDAIPKEELEKKRSTPQASDAKASFNVPASNGKITDKQYGKIVNDAKQKGVDENGIKEIVRYVKHKDLGDLTKAEASAVIDFLTKTTQEELDDIIMNASLSSDGDE